jgi:glycosyltransferase involved in cell wall biosynthesis
LWSKLRIISATTVRSIATIAIVSFRLGGTDGVSAESAKWARAFSGLGHDVITVAGEGSADRMVEGLATDAPEAPTRSEVDRALADADVAVIENLCSLPLNPAAAAVLADVLRGRPAVLRHHDLPWQRARFAQAPPPPDDPAWAHVTINRISEAELADRGIKAITIYNAFAVDDAAGAPAEPLGDVDLPRPIVLQPTRAIARKNVPAALRLAEALGGSYWITGDAEDGYNLDAVLAGAEVPVLHRPVTDVARAYATCDVVAFPSTFEGFGNPVVESAVYRRPLAVADYPVLRELASFGFRWFPVDQPDRLAEIGGGVLQHNFEIARRHFSLADLPARLAGLFERQGWRL